MDYTFILGKPVLPVRPAATDRRKVFLIGAYPSALHVRKTHRELSSPVAAIAVDNEPEPFWTGIDEAEKSDAWRESIGLFPVMA